MRPEHQYIIAIILLVILAGIHWIIERLACNRKARQLEAAKSKTPRPLKPKDGDDCVECCNQKDEPSTGAGRSKKVVPWSEVKSRRGRKKEIVTQGQACNNKDCVYYHNIEEAEHALVGYGSHGKQEKIQDLVCQACGKKFTVRRDTVLYRLKTHSEKVGMALALLAEGVDVSALERVMRIREGTLRTWLSRAGEHAEKLHEEFFQEMVFAHIQLDELWADVRQASQEVWLWVAMEANSKVIAVVKLGPRTLDMAMGVVHSLCCMMAAGCMPVFSSDGLRLYFYALTAHFGEWVREEGDKRSIWRVSCELLYGQVKKIQRRRRLVRVEHNMMWGEMEKLKERLRGMGLSGRINTAFVERINLSIRQGVSFLVRRTWGTAQWTPELELHLEWWRGYYHFSRYHQSLRVRFTTPLPRKGRQQPRRYRSRTPAMAAGLTDHRWSVLELISYPLP
jgi:transposase-like protein/IS1 family transposase